MNFIGKLFGGLVGALFPPFGILFGILVGHFVDMSLSRRKSWSEEEEPAGETGDFLTSSFYFFGLCSQQAGHDHRTEEILRNLLTYQLRLHPFQTMQAYQAFNWGSNGSESPIQYLTHILSRYQVDARTRGWILNSALSFLQGRKVELARSLESLLGSGGHYQKSWPEESLDNDYLVLGVSPNTPLAEVRTQFRTLAKKYHPDRWSGPQHTEEQRESARSQFMEIQKAWERVQSREEGSHL